LLGSRSQIVKEELPVDDPQQRRPDISVAREILDWAPTIALRGGLTRVIDESPRETLLGRQASERAPLTAKP
ncbi:MAG: NAD-dependent epimerase/dehydratase, partial [Thermoleophilia bacterium]|nr:NAD-dependent epimerase/dehydratase [Thermoleophilia bacterium]